MSNIAEIVELYKRHCTAAKCRVNSAVIEQLQKRSILTSIDLSANYVGCKGLVPILEVARAAPTVEVLILSNNGLDNDTIVLLTDVLREHKGIHTLDVSCNPITFLGGKALLELVEHSTRITTVNVAGTDLYESIVKRIYSTVESNRTARGIKETLIITPVEVSQQGVLATRPVLSTQQGKPALVSQYLEQKETEPHVAAPAPRPPPPAVASDVSSRLTPAQRMAARENYRKRLERSSDFAKLGIQGDAASVARGARDELEMLIRQQKQADTDRHIKALSSIDETLDVDVQRSAVVPVPQPAAPSPLKDSPPQKDSPAKLEVLAVEETSASIATFVSKEEAPPPPVPLRRRISEQKPKATPEECPEVTSIQNASPCHEETPKPLPKTISEPEELFKTLFAKGSESYQSNNMAVAFSSWNKALEVANECQNHEWVAIIRNNLQRLSFDLLMQQGNENLKEKNTDEAIENFLVARETALRARNAAWVADTERGIRQARNAAFQLRHDRASQILDELTKEGPHDSSIFDSEWKRMLKVKEAMECWADATQSASQMKGSSGQMLVEVAATALDVLYNYQFQRMFISDITYLPRQTAFRTHAFTFSEKKQLVSLYSDILSCARKLKHRRWEALVRCYLGCLYHGVYENTQALDNYLDFIEIGRDMDDDTFQAVGHALVASHQLQLSRFSEADRSLKQALLLLERVRKCFSARQLATPSNAPVRAVQQFCASSEFVSYLQWFCYFQLQQVLVGLTRTSEALEAAERCKSLLHTDVLTEKIQRNFSPHTTLQNMIRCAGIMDCVFVQYSIVHRVDWNTHTESPDFDEHIYIWMIPKEGEKVKFHLVETAKVLKVPSLQPLIKELRIQLCVEPETQSKDIFLELPQGLWRNTLRQLHRVLVYPLVDELHTHTAYSQEGVGRVVLVPDGVLWLVPFNALLDENDVFFIERFSLSMAPSIVFTSFCNINTTKARERKGERRVCLTVAEELEGTDLVPFNFQGESLMRESQRLAKVVDGEVLNAGAEKVTKLVLRQTLACTSFVHVTLPVCPGATENRVLGAFTLTGKSGFSDLLFSTDIEQWDVPAQIVGVSHCNVDFHDVVGGQNPMINLSRAWVSAGAASVIVTLWSTPDVMSDDYYADLYETLQCTHETIQAVTVSIRNLLKVYRHSPKMWAGYVILGVDA